MNMNTQSCIARWSPILVTLCSFWPLVAVAAQPGIRDDARFFKPETVQQASDVLRDIQQQNGKQVVIETFPTIPANLQKRFNASSDKERFYHEWGYNRGKDLGLDGIYILIVRMPGHLEIVSGQKTSRRAFPKRDEDRLKQILVGSFREKRYDEGLMEGVRFIQSAMGVNLRGQSTQPSAGSNSPVQPESSNPLPGPLDNGPSSVRPVPQTNPPPVNPSPRPTGNAGGFGLGSLFCIGAAVLILILIVRAVRRRGGGYGTPPYGSGMPPGGGGYYGGGGGGGGGFGRGLMGGFLGGLFGNWMADRWSNQGRNDGGHTGAGGFFNNSGGPDNSGGDFGGTTSSGGDFGASSGGDLGGGGGSDFGGGGGSDSGGGGDFGGTSSSGGDF